MSFSVSLSDDRGTAKVDVVESGLTDGDGVKDMFLKATLLWGRGDGEAAIKGAGI